ncbi:hypothetical protein [Alkalihalobacillus sp. 1P02AB]|uniref:hypothetical protein n=1 Tax=Alkalihalobacillus sp. 1P02AB TaxID=3132260 RepID=UPI0039A76C02
MSKKYLYLCTPQDLDNVEDIRLFIAENEEKCVEEIAKIESTNELFRESYELIKGDYFQLALKLIKNGEWMKVNVRKVAEIDGAEEFQVLH